jgi:hypothetical protein
MILLTGALLSGFLGYRLTGWWVPIAVACAVLLLQALAYQDMLSTADGVSRFAQALTLIGLACLLMFYATFGVGRWLALRWRTPR